MGGLFGSDLLRRFMPGQTPPTIGQPPLVDIKAPMPSAQPQVMLPPPAAGAGAAPKLGKDSLFGQVFGRLRGHDVGAQDPAHQARSMGLLNAGAAMMGDQSGSLFGQLGAGLQAGAGAYHGSIADARARQAAEMQRQQMEQMQQFLARFGGGMPR